jgi:hypothetical protein
MALAMEIAEKVDANVDFADKALGYYSAMEKAGHGSKDFGYCF